MSVYLRLTQIKVGSALKIFASLPENINSSWESDAHLRVRRQHLHLLQQLCHGGFTMALTSLGTWFTLALLQ